MGDPARARAGALQPVRFHRIALQDDAGGGTLEVVGVVGDIRNSDIDAPALPQLYLAHAQDPARGMALAVQVRGDPLQQIDAVRRAVWTVDPAQPVFDVRSMQQVVYDDLSDSYLLASLFAVFALVALLMAASGVYGVVAYSVSRRTREIGIRSALGADERQIVRLFLRQAARWVLSAMLIGLGAGWLAAHAMGALLYGVTPADPVNVLATAALLCAVALAACYLPARRASRVDPTAALRAE